jgi:hypothetical protein
MDALPESAGKQHEQETGQMWFMDRVAEEDDRAVGAVQQVEKKLSLRREEIEERKYVLKASRARCCVA